MRKTSLILALLLGCALPSGAGVLRTEAPQKAVPQYGRADFTIYVQGSWDNPWLQEEAALDMQVTAPSGKVLLVPCFYVSGESGGQSRWEARFTPQEKGRYSYAFIYREKGKAESPAGGGRFKVTGPRGRHGILHTNGLWTLRYDDGTLFRGIGENLCWESRTEDDSKYFKTLHEQHERFSYPAMLPKLASQGGNFTRMWMCSWNFPIDRPDRFNNARYTPADTWINPSAALRLDRTLALAESLDIRIMLCLGPGDVTPDRDFFISGQAKARWRNYLRYIVARWGCSPSVAMWEFFNEIDNIQFRRADAPIPAEEIVAWHREMAAYLRSIDPYGHIVTTSISHRDLPGLNDVEGIDINQKHIYCATGAIPETIRRYGHRHGKPYVIGEYGYEWDWSKNFDDFAEEMKTDFRRGLWYGLFSPTPVLPLSWWWEWFDREGTAQVLREVRKVSDEMLRAGKGSFIPVEARAEGTDAYAVRCGRKTWVYVYNPGDKALTRVTVGEKEIKTAVPAKGEAIFVIK